MHCAHGHGVADVSMANKPSSTAVSTATAPAPAAASAAPATAPAARTVASAKGTQVLPETPTDLQRGVDAFADVFTNLAGGSPEPEEKAPTAPKARRDTTEPEQIPKATEAPAEAEPEADEIIPGDEPDDDGAVLTDDAATRDEDEDGAGEGKDVKIEEKLFKAREKRRALEAELKAEREQREALSKKLEAMATAAPSGVVLPEISGAYANIKEAAHVDAVVDWINEQDAMLDDFLETHDDSIEHPQFGVLDRKGAKQMRRNLAAEAARADKVREALVKHATHVTQSTEKARKLYPFAFNAESKHNAIVLDLVKEEPALNTLPSKSLAIGRMAVGKLIEDAPPAIRRQISALLAGKAATPVPTTAAAAPAPLKSVPSPAPSAPRQPRAAREPEPESDDDTRRLINGDPRAAQDWAASLLG